MFELGRSKGEYFSTNQEKYFTILVFAVALRLIDRIYGGMTQEHKQKNVRLYVILSP
jgi:hypothetical protein